MGDNENKADQTATARTREKALLGGKRVLVVGSGSDLDGRMMGDTIDNTDTYAAVIRVNKMYGRQEDVGRRAEILFTRWTGWLDNHDFFSQDVLDGARFIVVTNQHVGVSKTEISWLSRQVGHDQVSCGAIAVHWALCMGASDVDVIGFGFRDGAFLRDKVYTGADNRHIPKKNTDGTKDVNPAYDWHKEREWLMRQPRVHMLP